MLIALSVVLPIVRHDAGAPPGDAFLLGDSSVRVRECRMEHPEWSTARCVVAVASVDALLAFPFLWPVAALVVARREWRRRMAAVGLAVEPLLLLLTAGILALVSFSDTAIGWWVAVVGVPVYYIGWSMQVVPLIVGRPEPPVGAQAP
ncbi:MAG TPA: hypothetical protein VMU00_11700 [Steroidobacteraceae bacterium]|nr:hypothetical protein [Steroidobacteraceae bacterium]